MDMATSTQDAELERGEIALQAILNSSGRIRQPVDDWLNQVDYAELNSGLYMPTAFSLKFMNFIKLVNGEEGEQHKTPVFHLAMLDEIAGLKKNIANLCARGTGKTTLMIEYMAPYLGVIGEIDGFGKVPSLIYVSDSMDNGVKSARQNMEFRYETSEFLQEWLPYAHFTENFIEFKSKDGNRFGMKMFGAKTGLRGTKIDGKRPVLAVLDDLVSDDDANSPAAMKRISDTVYKGVDFALDPTRRKIIFNGTPFNKNDILYAAVESGGWHVNVWPICEKFPCTKEEFKGAWEDRFSYEYVKEQYETAILTGTLSAFNQELMLRITSAEERLVQDEEIRWYKRTSLLANKSNFNFYITTDFATKAKQHNDLSVISVWAYNSNGDWFWVDGIAKKQTMDKNIDDLFRLVQEYSPQGVGVEISGQQGAFIQWIQQEMMSRNVWFNFANGKNNMPGINPDTDKMSRFNLVLPLFKAGKMYFPDELKLGQIMGEMLEEVTMATITGFKSKHDDFLDTISMLMYLKPWKPSEATPLTQKNEGPWEYEDSSDTGLSGLSSYLV